MLTFETCASSEVDALFAWQRGGFDDVKAAVGHHEDQITNQYTGCRVSTIWAKLSWWNDKSGTLAGSFGRVSFRRLLRCCFLLEKTRGLKSRFDYLRKVYRLRIRPSSGHRHRKFGLLNRGLKGSRIRESPKRVQFYLLSDSHVSIFVN